MNYNTILYNLTNKNKINQQNIRILSTKFIHYNTPLNVLLKLSPFEKHLNKVRQDYQSSFSPPKAVIILILVFLISFYDLFINLPENSILNHP